MWTNETYTKYFPTENEFNLLMAIARKLGDGCDINDAIRFCVMTTYQAYKSTVGHPDEKQTKDAHEVGGGEVNGEVSTTQDSDLQAGAGSAEGCIGDVCGHACDPCSCGGIESCNDSTTGRTVLLDANGRPL